MKVAAAAAAALRTRPVSFSGTGIAEAAWEAGPRGGAHDLHGRRRMGPGGRRGREQPGWWRLWSSWGHTSGADSCPGESCCR